MKSVSHKSSKEFWNLHFCISSGLIQYQYSFKTLVNLCNISPGQFRKKYDFIYIPVYRYIYGKTPFYWPPIHRQTRIPPWNYQVLFSFHVKTLVIMPNSYIAIRQVSKDQMVNLLLIVSRYNANQLCHTSMILQVFVIFTGR